MKIGILLAGHFLQAENGGNPDYDVMFSELLDGHGFDFEAWNVVDMDFPASHRDADGWLITGSKHGVYDDLPFIAPLEDFIRAAFADGVPMVGICFGHQIIAQALGGKVVKFPGGWQAGAETYDFGDERLPLHAWHQDQVIEPPEGAETIATSENCAHAALLYGGRALTIQPHPEFTKADVSSLIDLRGPQMPPEVIAEAVRKMDADVANDIIADRIAAFFKVAHG